MKYVYDKSIDKFGNVCPNCGKKLSTHCRRLIWEIPSGGSWKDYHLVIKDFCTVKCYNEFRQKKYDEIKRLLSSGAKGLRLILIKRNLTFKLDMFTDIFLVGTMIVLLFVIKGDIFSLVLPLVGLLIFLGMTIFRLMRPWIITSLGGWMIG